MKKTQNKKLNNKLSLLKDNRGSGIVTVIIAMVLMFSIASSVLMVTYTGFQMKISQRLGNEVSIDAATAMNEIKVGLQNVVSDCITTAYLTTLKDYSKNNLNVQSEFAQNFINTLFAYTVKTESGEVKPLFRDNKYETDALQEIVKITSDTFEIDNYSISSEDNEVETNIDINKREGKITLKNIRVRISKQSNEAAIIGNISISIPDIGSSLSQYTITGIPEFACIVGGELIHNTIYPETSISGSVYAGSVKLGGNETKMNHSNGVFVCRNDIDVKGNAAGDIRFTSDNTSTLWAKDIKVHFKSSVSLGGISLIGNDLSLDGAEARAKLRGKYYGFGSDATNASESSAIMANAKNTTLDLSEVDELTLSGVCFIQDAVSASNNVVTGESITTRETQRIYLIPAEDLTYRIKEGEQAYGDYYDMPSNPAVYSTSDGYTKIKVYLDTSKVLWTVGTKPYTYKDYGITVKTMGEAYSNQSIAYYFIQFGQAGGRTASENANLYFQHYFKHHTDEIKEYLDNYIQVITDSDTNIKTKGNTVSSGESSISINKALNSTSANTIGITSELYERMFNSACTTLTYSEVSGIEPLSVTPFEYYVNKENIETINKNRDYDNQKIKDFKVQNESGTQESVVTMIVNGNYTVDENTPDSCALLIVDGNVTLNRDFTGLILCSGNLDIINGNLTSSETSFYEAYNALGDDWNTYFNTDPTYGDNWATSGKGADVLNLVQFDSWNKE